MVLLGWSKKVSVDHRPMTDGIRLNDINIWINIPDELRTDIVTLPTSDKLLSDIPIFTSAYQRKILSFLEPTH